MISRRDADDSASTRTGRYVLWVLVVAALGAGIVLALKSGRSVTPLLDTLH